MCIDSGKITSIQGKALVTTPREELNKETAKMNGQKLFKRLGDLTLKIRNNIPTFRVIGQVHFLQTHIHIYIKYFY